MLTKQLEVVARAGQFVTEGSANRMAEYAMGLNYYVFGQELENSDGPDVHPQRRLYEFGYGTSVNTQDLIARVQLQWKF